MYLLALTGGIASGKSTVARRLASHGAIHIDADQLARSAVAPGSSGLRQIRERFGPAVFTGAGDLDRAALGAIVFADPESLADLNAIVHPAVRELGDEEIARAVRQNADAIVVYDVPLLVEGGVMFDWDLVVVTEAPPEVRIDRMVHLRGMSEKEAHQRIANQASEDERRAIADVVIDTSGTQEATDRQVDALWERLLASGGTRRTNRAGTVQ